MVDTSLEFLHLSFVFSQKSFSCKLDVLLMILHINLPVVAIVTKYCSDFVVISSVINCKISFNQCTEFFVSLALRSYFLDVNQIFKLKHV